MTRGNDERRNEDIASPLETRVAASLAAPVSEAVRDFARSLGQALGARAVLFYGSNLRSRALDGILDFYVLTAGPRERGLWPRVGYREQDHAGTMLRAKVATMRLSTFAHAASGEHVDTTIWARFVQPVALAWSADETARREVTDAVAGAIETAARFAAALGPDRGTETDYWQALFRATYRAELRVEKPGREQQILTFGKGHFNGLLTLGWDAGGIGWSGEGGLLRPRLPRAARKAIVSRWARRRRAGKPLNVARLLRAATTFEGGARYLAWKIERHSGIQVPLTPFRERHPLISAPVLIAAYLRARRRRG